MEIDKGLAARYHKAPLGQYLEDFGDLPETKKAYLETFLLQAREAENEAMGYLLAGEGIPSQLAEVLAEKKRARAALERLNSQGDAS